MSTVHMGKRIRELREAAGMTQARLAKLIGVTRSAISQIESGLTKGVRPQHLLALSEHLKAPVELIVNGRKGTELPISATVVRQPIEPYLASLTTAEVELLQHLREAGGDHEGRDELARQAIALLRALRGPNTEQGRPRH